MKKIFVSSVQKEFERERAAIKRMIESDPILKPHFKAFVFEIDAPASDKTTQQVYLKEIEKCSIYLVLIGNKYGYCDEDGVSPTEQEFDRAKELGLTTLVMVRGRDDSKREEKESRFLKKVSDGRVRIRYQDLESEQAAADLLDEVRNSLRDIMLDDGILSETPFEDQVATDVSMDDISEDRIKWFVDAAVRNRKANYQAGMSVEDVLRTLHLINRKTSMPTKAAILLFGKDVPYFFQSSQIKCATYAGTKKEKPNVDVRLIEGDLFRLADQAISYINEHLDDGAGERTNGAVADEVREIPNPVVAEAVNNAIAHRNYASPGSIQVEVYRDRVEIINPGRLHSALTIQDLYKKHESYPPNARIAHAFYQVKYIEALGTGITDMLRRCKEHGLRKPLMEEISGKFKIVLWRMGKVVSPTAEKYMQLASYIKASKAMSVEAYAEALGLKVKVARTMIDKMRIAGLVRREGARRNGRWMLCKEIDLSDCQRLCTGEKRLKV